MYHLTIIDTKAVAQLLLDQGMSHDPKDMGEFHFHLVSALEHIHDIQSNVIEYMKQLDWEKKFKESRVPEGKFFEKYGNRLIKAAKEDPEFGNFLFLHPEETDKVMAFNPDKYQVVSIHETETGENSVDMTIPCDFGSQPHKIGYYVIPRDPFNNE